MIRTRDGRQEEAIYCNTSDMTNISFPVGKGAPFIQTVTDAPLR